MSKTSSAFDGKVTDLKNEFDRSFALPLVLNQAEHSDLIAFRSNGGLFAIAITDLSGLERAKKVTPVPGQSRHCRGVAGIRGSVVPVFDLPEILHGEIKGNGKENAGWFALCRSQTLVAFEFDGFEGHLRISRENLYPLSASDPGLRHASRSFRVGSAGEGQSGLVLDIKRILELVTK